MWRTDVVPELLWLAHLCTFSIEVFTTLENVCIHVLCFCVFNTNRMCLCCCKRSDENVGRTTSAITISHVRHDSISAVDYFVSESFIVLYFKCGCWGWRWTLFLVFVDNLTITSTIWLNTAGRKTHACSERCYDINKIYLHLSLASWGWRRHHHTCKTYAQCQPEVVSCIDHISTLLRIITRDLPDKPDDYLSYITERRIGFP